MVVHHGGASGVSVGALWWCFLYLSGGGGGGVSGGGGDSAFTFNGLLFYCSFSMLLLLLSYLRLCIICPCHFTPT